MRPDIVIHTLVIQRGIGRLRKTFGISASVSLGFFVIYRDRVLSRASPLFRFRRGVCDKDDSGVTSVIVEKFDRTRRDRRRYSNNVLQFSISRASLGVYLKSVWFRLLLPSLSCLPLSSLAGRFFSLTLPCYNTRYTTHRQLAISSFTVTLIISYK